jgi:hypothetical protein
MSTQETIEQIILNKIEEIGVEDIVREVIRDYINRELRSNIKNIVDTEAKAYVNAEIEEQLKHAVTIDNGWGDTKKFPSFEVMFRSEVKKCLDSKWEIERIIHRNVEERINGLVKSTKEAVVEKMVDELTKTQIKKQ